MLLHTWDFVQLTIRRPVTRRIPPLRRAIQRMKLTNLEYLEKYGAAGKNRTCDPTLTKGVQHSDSLRYFKLLCI